MGALFTWWIAIEMLGIIALPLTATALANLPDGGWTFSKPLGLLALGWLVWLPLVTFSALPYSRLWIAATCIVFGLGNLALLRRPALRATLRALLTYQRRHLLVAEALFALAFALFAWFRSFTPAVVDTEKFMDVAFLASLWRTPHLPAPDPWLSGAPINYYYFGHFLLATLAKLLGTVPGTAFNIGTALIFALASLTIYGVATNLTALLTAAPRTLGQPAPAVEHPVQVAGAAVRRALPYGLASVLLVLLLGNLNGAQIWWQNATALARQQPGLLASPWAWWVHRDLWTSYDWWSPSRVIPGTINEFPAFSFVLADLHAHILALPFAMLALGFGLNLLHARGAGLAAFGSGAQRIVALVATGVALGSLYAINGWDLPTYLGLALLALAVQQWTAHRARFSAVLALDLFSGAAVVGALSILAFLPFYRGFVSPSEGIALVPLVERTPIGYEIAIFGLPLFIVGSLVAVWAARSIPSALQRVLPTASDSTTPSTRPVAGVAVAVVAAVVLLLLLATAASASNPNWTLFWCVALVLLCAALAVHRLLPPHIADATDISEASAAPHAAAEPTVARADVYMLMLIGTAAALVLACEVVFLRDIFGSRMNTVFKLYFQAWALLGVAAGPALALLVSMAQRELVGFPARAARTLGAYAAPRPRLHGGSLAFATMQPWDNSAIDAHSSDGSFRGPRRPIRALLSAIRLAAVAGQPPIEPLYAAGRENTVNAAASHGAHGDIPPPALRWWRLGGILLWTAALLALTGAALIYPVLATSARTGNFAPTSAHTLDGTAYMATDPLGQPATCTSPGAGTDHGDQAAIAWLNTHITGSEVIVEAPGCEWSHYSRISAFTGLPTLLGWPGGHEGEWRTNWLRQHTQSGMPTDIFGERAAAINRIYTDSNQATVVQLLQRYHVGLIYVGAAERALYPRSDLSRFGTVLTPIYNQDGITIYAVRAAGQH